MKKFLKYLLIITLFSAWGIILTSKDQVREAVKETLKSFEIPCEKPLKYSIGIIDPQFGISDDQLKVIAAEAEKVWETSLGKNLFEYESSSAFKINLVFDNRQKETVESENMQEKLGNLGLSYDSASKEYASLSLNYKKQTDAYNKGVADYRQKLERYNEKVSYWNEKGGAPGDVYDDLRKEKKELDKEFSQLENERKYVNGLAGKANTAAEKTNQIANNYNQSLNTYKDRFGGSQQFDKGVYDGESINIYQFYEFSDLRLTISHELGHALGADHVENSRSVMFYLMGDQDMNNPQATKDDLAEIERICRRR